MTFCNEFGAGRIQELQAQNGFVLLLNHVNPNHRICSSFGRKSACRSSPVFHAPVRAPHQTLSTPALSTAVTQAKSLKMATCSTCVFVFVKKNTNVYFSSKKVIFCFFPFLSLPSGGLHFSGAFFFSAGAAGFRQIDCNPPSPAPGPGGGGAGIAQGARGQHLLYTADDFGRVAIWDVGLILARWPGGRSSFLAQHPSSVAPCTFGLWV